jgi:hypothetical protein
LACLGSVRDEQRDFPGGGLDGVDHAIEDTTAAQF